MATVVATVNTAQAKVDLDITFAPTVTHITVGRRDPSGYTQLIRYGDEVALTAGAVRIDDHEAPLDVPVTYIATQALPVGSEFGESAEVVVPSNGVGWLKDPGYPSTNLRLDVITSIEELARPSRAGVFNILDRANPVVITAKRQGVVGELVCHTMTDADRKSMTAILSRGTVLLLQTPYAYGFGSAYVHIGDATETRVGLAMEPSRRWTLPFVETDRPEGLAVQPITDRTWGAVNQTHASWAALAGTGKSFRELLEQGP